MSETTNAVRKVLMNELGLSRESVRAIAAEIVQSTVQRQIEQGGFLERLIRSIVYEELGKLLNKSPWSITSEPALVSMVKEAARNEAKRLFEEHVRITIEGAKAEDPHA